MRHGLNCWMALFGLAGCSEGHQGPGIRPSMDAPGGKDGDAGASDEGRPLGGDGAYLLFDFEADGCAGRVVGGPRSGAAVPLETIPYLGAPDCDHRGAPLHGARSARFSGASALVTWDAVRRAFPEAKELWVSYNERVESFGGGFGALLAFQTHVAEPSAGARYREARTGVTVTTNDPDGDHGIGAPNMQGVCRYSEGPRTSHHPVARGAHNVITIHLSWDERSGGTGRVWIRPAGPNGEPEGARGAPLETDCRRDGRWPYPLPRGFAMEAFGEGVVAVVDRLIISTSERDMP